MNNAIFDNGISCLYQGDALALPLPDDSVHCVVTSPPYWGLRDYGLGEWAGGDADCQHKKIATPAPEIRGGSGYLGSMEVPRKSARAAVGAGYDGNPHAPLFACPLGCGAVKSAEGIGVEDTLDEHLANIVAVGREIKRVLRADGTFWLNYGDAYAGAKPFSMVTFLPAKNLLGLPWRVAFALQDDGWILRSAIVWHKPNPMPESVIDRPTNSYEMIFLFAQQPRYFYDAEAIRTPASDSLIDKVQRNQAVNGRRLHGDAENGEANMGGYIGRQRKRMPEGLVSGIRNRDVADSILGANARNVWTFPTQGRKDAHFATFPDELPRRCILAGTSEKGVCADCGAPYVRDVETSGGMLGQSWHDHSADLERGRGAGHWARLDSDSGSGVYQRETTGWRATCECDAAVVPATVLDPFIGSGTTCAVAQSLGRRSVGVDLNADYLRIAEARLQAVSMPMRLA